MSQQDMLTAIINAIQTDANLIILLRASVTLNIPNVSVQQLQAIMTLLNLPTTP